MTPAVLLVDDQRDVLRLLHSVLDTLQQTDLDIIEAASGEEALRETSRRHLDLMVVDYRLPGMTGLEMMHQVRAAQPDIKVILITGMADRNARAEMLNAGAVAVFGKPVPLADFLDIVEKSLGLRRAIFPGETEQTDEAESARITDLLANFRQDVQASAVFLINERGLVVARAGDLWDSSTEASLVSALAASTNAGIRVARANRQESLDQFSVFSGGDHDLILMPIDESYSLLMAGNDFANADGLLEAIKSMRAVRMQMSHSLRSIEAPRDTSPTPPQHGANAETAEAADSAASPEIEALFNEADRRKIEAHELNAFWDEAAARHVSQPNDPDVISYEEARKLGLTPDEK